MDGKGAQHQSGEDHHQATHNFQSTMSTRYTLEIGKNGFDVQGKEIAPASQEDLTKKAPARC